MRRTPHPENIKIEDVNTDQGKDNENKEFRQNIRKFIISIKRKIQTKNTNYLVGYTGIWPLVLYVSTFDDDRTNLSVDEGW